MAYLYRHIRLDNDQPFYIGVGGLISNDNFFRAYKKRNRNPLWNNVVSKTEYEVEILLSGITHEEALKREVYFISLYGRKNINTGILVNLTDGGDGCNNMKHSETTKKIHSQRISGINHPNYGKTTSEETKQKLRAKLRGRKDINHSLRMANNRNSCKKVVDINSNEIYNSCIEAANGYGINYPALKAMLNGYNPNKTPLRYVPAHG